MSVRTNWEMHGLSEPAVRSFEMQIRGEVIHPGERWSICRDSEGSPFALAIGGSA